jgi:hypothetical protein
LPTKSFSSFEAFFDANQHASLRAMVLGPDRGNWILTNLVLGGLSVQFGQAGGNAVVEGSPQPGGISIFILTHGLSAMSGNGHRRPYYAGPEAGRRILFSCRCLEALVFFLYSE